MKGSDLRGLFLDAGFELDVSSDDKLVKIADQMKIAPATLKQNFKPSVEVPESIEAAARTYLGSVHDSARMSLRLKHRAHLTNLVLSVFHELLPNISIQDFDVYPTLLAERARADFIPDHSTNVASWSHFIDEFTGRLERVYTKEKTVLMGCPGSGKTSVMKRLLLDIERRDNRWTPVFISAAIYDDAEVESLFHAVSLHYERAWGGWTHEFPIMSLIQKEWEQKRLVIFVDSLDEATVAQRRHLVSHVIECPAPLIISSRYCDPAIDVADRFTQHIFHLGGLSFTSVRSYLGRLRTEIGRRIKVQSNGHNAQELDESESEHLLTQLMKEFEYFEASYPASSSASDRPKDDIAVSPEGPLAKAVQDRLFPVNKFLFEDSCERDQYPRRSEVLADRTRRAKECLTLLASPIYLNLYIALCLRRGINTIAIDKLVDSYVSMLLGRWQKSRSVYRRLLPDDDIDESKVVNSLGAIAFHSIIREHVDGEFPSLGEVKIQLKHHLKLSDLSNRSESELDQDVQRVLEVAQGTSGLITLSTGARVRFAAPHELFATYFTGLYISRARGTIESGRYKHRRTIVSEDRIEFASYGRFLENPNLRFLEDAVVLYLQSDIGRSNVSPFELADRLEDAMSIPPIGHHITGCTDDEVLDILPANMIMVGRVFMLPAARIHFGSIFNRVKDIIEASYINTNYEILFQAVSPIYHAIAGDHRTGHRSDHGTATFRALDKAWRIARTCNELLDLARQVEKSEVSGGNRSHDENKKIILRRIAYMMRYCASTFSDAAFAWMEDRYKAYGEDSKDSARRHLVLNSLRMIYDNMQTTTTTLYKRLEEWVWRHKNDAARNRDQFVAKMREFESATRDARTFVQRILESDDINIHELDMYPTELAKRLPRSECDYEEAVCYLFDKLKTRQQERQTLEADKGFDKAPSKWGRVIHDEARALRLMMYIANSFVGQQYFMPEEYSLSKAGAFYPRTKYDRDALLRFLFNGVKQTKESNSVHYAVGSWQLYDFYVQCIWTLMRYLPSQSHYMYLS